jgi:glycosyltransferase involved in cell wall biosynthesis
MEIAIFGLSKEYHTFYHNYKNIQVYSGGIDSSVVTNPNPSLTKLRYLKAPRRVKRLIRQFKPDLIHAHYASSYGLIGALSDFHPYVLSVWGADIFEFPNKSLLHRELLKFNLKKADNILSTSHTMARATRQYISKPIKVTPWGVDLNTFRPRKVPNLFRENDIIIGTIKGLEAQYGVEYLIKAFQILRAKYPYLPLKLLIVGGGSLEQSLKALVKELNLADDTIFAGRISHDSVSDYHNMLSIYVALSVIDSESFGVAVVEASACEKPVVVSNVGGLPEVVENGTTGFVVSPRDPEKAAEAIEKLILDKELCIKMGQAGRERVKKLYRWEDSVKQMISIYQTILEDHRN